MKISILKLLRILSLIIFAFASFVCVDFALNFQSALFLMDGSIACSSLLHRAFGIFGDQGWSIQIFFRTYAISLWVVLFLGIENIVLTCLVIAKSPARIDKRKP